jgi:hypothetical protein
MKLLNEFINYACTVCDMYDNGLLPAIEWNVIGYAVQSILRGYIDTLDNRDDSESAA